MREGEERETGEQRREERDVAGRRQRGGQKQLKQGWDARTGPCCVAI